MDICNVFGCQLQLTATVLFVGNDLSYWPSCISLSIPIPFVCWLCSDLCWFLSTSLLYRCYLQKRVLNLSKGPAVRALRAQTDKREYAMEMRTVVER